MTSSFYVRLLLGIVVIILGIVFIVAVAWADQPTPVLTGGWEKVAEIVDREGIDVGLAIKIVEITIPDKYSEGNEGGTLTLFAGKSPHMLGVAVITCTSEGDAFFGLALYLDRTTGACQIKNFITREVVDVDAKTAEEFINNWMTIYHAIKGIEI